MAEDDLAQRLAGLQTLLDVTRAIAAEVDLTATMDVIGRCACTALECDRASVFLYDEARNELFTRFVTQLEIAEIRHGLDSGISGDVARHRHVANIKNPAADPRWDSSTDQQTGYQTRNILAAPLASVHDGSLLGVIEVINKLEGTFSSFDEELLVAFGQHAAVALDRARVIHELKRRSQVEASLNIARDIQRSFMPRRLPDIPSYEIATWWYPTDAVGGDYCDVLELPDGRLGLVIADVSGHGIGPSLIMASVRASLRTLALGESSAESLLNHLSRSLGPDLVDGRFITMVVVVIDPTQHTVEYANAGHAPALQLHAATAEFTRLDATGVPLGVLDEPQYPLGTTLRLEARDMIILCTDGIVEAMDERGRQYGRERLERLIANRADQPLEDLVDRIADDVSNYHASSSPDDDLTILVARRIG